MGQIHPMDNCRATEMRFSGGRTIANRQGRGVPSRHEPGERALILAECWLGVAWRHLQLNPVRIAGSRPPCGLARLEPGRRVRSW